MHWIHSPTISTIHGFSTRHGGVSPAPFDSLNLGGIDDLPENIAENRKRALSELHIEFTQVSYLNQIHSNVVCQASIGKQTGDALVTNKKNICIAVGAADKQLSVRQRPEPSQSRRRSRGNRQGIENLRAQLGLQSQRRNDSRVLCAAESERPGRQQPNAFLRR